MTKRGSTLTALVALVGLVLGCQERPTALQELEVPGPQAAKGGGQESTRTVTFIFRDAPEDFVKGDTRVTDDEGRTMYVGAECGVATMMPSYNYNAYLNTKSTRIKPSEETSCGGKAERDFMVSFQNNRVLEDGYPAGGLDWDGEAVDAKWMQVYYHLRDIPVGGTRTDQHLSITFDDQSKHGVGGNGWGAACPNLLKFDSSKWPSSSDVRVTRIASDEWEVVVAPPNDIAVCLGRDGDQPIPVGYYHVPFQVNVTCTGDC